MKFQEYKKLFQKRNELIKRLASSNSNKERDKFKYDLFKINKQLNFDETFYRLNFLKVDFDNFLVKASQFFNGFSEQVKFTENSEHHNYELLIAGKPVYAFHYFYYRDDDGYYEKYINVKDLLDFSNKHAQSGRAALFAYSGFEDLLWDLIRDEINKNVNRQIKMIDATRIRMEQKIRKVRDLETKQREKEKLNLLKPELEENKNELKSQLDYVDLIG